MIKEQLPFLISETMKAGNKVKLEALRAVKTAFMNWETAKENVIAFLSAIFYSDFIPAYKKGDIILTLNCTRCIIHLRTVLYN